MQAETSYVTLLKIAGSDTVDGATLNAVGGKRLSEVERLPGMERSCVSARPATSSMGGAGRVLSAMG